MTKKLLFLVTAILLVSVACNLPLFSRTSSPQQSPPALVTAPATDANSTVLPASTNAATNVPVLHVIKPSDSVAASGAINYDVDSSSTASQHRAPYGDSYDLNLLERPFTQQDMTYIPSLDINTFQISTDGTWDYVFIRLIGNNPNDPTNIDYGVEINKTLDGFGDVLVWAQPPYSTQWTTDGVKVFTDPNHDTGGASPEKSDANATTSAPFAGDGYETVIFNHGQGDDPDLAWVRINPKDSSMVEFAFKNSLAGKSFMWGVWADGGLKDPTKFNYNDRFTLAQAGSPLNKNPNYPIKALYAVDNTCWSAYGFKPTGYEPHLCPTNAPPPAPHKGPTPVSCQLNYNICISQGYGSFDQATCSCIVNP